MKVEDKTKEFIEGLNCSDKWKKFLLEKTFAEPSKEFIEHIRKQGWYQIECPQCRWSNRKWLEGGKDIFRCPIRMNKVKTKTTIRIYYVCDNCNTGWEG